jgi:hypothetical protein
MCVLDWCKLFAYKQAVHHWRKIVSDLAKFEADLLVYLNLTPDEFQQIIDVIRLYRDKFIAHLDEHNIMDIPTLDLLAKAMWFYHAHVVTNEVQPGIRGAGHRHRDYAFLSSIRPCPVQRRKQRPLRRAVVSEAQALYRANGGKAIELTIGFHPREPITPLLRKLLPPELAHPGKAHRQLTGKQRGGKMAFS